MSTFLVIGDFMTDRYWIATDRGKSPEQADCNVYTIQPPKSKEELPGGAGNVVQNLTMLEQDAVVVAIAPYPIKTRIMVDGKQVVRFDINDQCIPANKNGYLAWNINNVEYDAIVVADYGKGSIGPAERKWILQSDKPLFVDTKGNPEVWEDRAWLFPNSSEFEQFEGVYRRASQVVLKRSADGIARLYQGKTVESYPAFTNQEQVVDVCGAGDTVMAAFATQTIAKPTTFSPLLFANAAAASVVRKPYTATTTIPEITQIVNSYLL